MKLKYYKNKNKRLNDSMRRAIAIFALFLMAMIFVPSARNIPLANAATEAELQAQLNDLQASLNQANADLKAKRNESATLAGEIASFDAQIYQIQVQINTLQAEINLTTAQIEETNTQIVKIEAEILVQKNILNEYLRIIYEDSQTSMIEQIAGADSFSDFVNRAEYLQTMQLKIRDAVNRIKALKTELEAKKADLETKNKDLGDKKNQQVSQRQAMDSQRAAKQALLDKTRGEEIQYKAMLTEIQTQLSQVQRSLWSIANSGNFISYGHVSRGDIIGYIGNSGYSTGCHLHFEIRTDPSSHVNPAGYLGNGYFTNPAPGVAINVPYGYSSAYFPGVFHSGIDLADGCAGTAIRATADGEIIKRVTGKPNTYPFSYEYGNYVMIQHTNGMFSLSAHMR